MKFSIEKDLDLSGPKASIYHLRVNDEEETLFERFMRENEEDYPNEVEEILFTVEAIGWDTGARNTYFKPAEGALGAGDGIEALFDEDRNLRLYCIRNGMVAIFLGGGGPKHVRALQDDPKLKKENYLLRLISKTIISAIKVHDLIWSPDGMELSGELTLSTENY